MMMAILRLVLLMFISLSVIVISSFDIHSSPLNIQRRDVFVIVASTIWSSTPPVFAEEKSYSSNARNMARLNAGDSSGGSIYDNNPTSPKARARRAMVGCKNPSARGLAGEKLGKKLSEKDCNLQVMSGDTDFMLETLTELDCATCPYGIGTR